MKKIIVLILTVMIMIPYSAFAFDFDGYSNDELIALNAELVAELVSRGIEKTATVVPGRYIVGKDIPAGKYILKNNTDGTAYIAVFKDNLQKYKDSESVRAINLYEGRETLFSLEEGQVLEIRHQRIQVTISVGIVFQ